MWRRCGQKFPRAARERRSPSPWTRTATFPKCSCGATRSSLCSEILWSQENELALYAGQAAFFLVLFFCFYGLNRLKTVVINHCRWKPLCFVWLVADSQQSPLGETRHNDVCAFCKSCCGTRKPGRPWSKKQFFFFFILIIKWWESNVAMKLFVRQTLLLCTWTIWINTKLALNNFWFKSKLLIVLTI